MVGFDTTILPGREGTIRPKVDLHNYQNGGEFTKSITVTSNASNTPTMRLTIKGVVKASVGANPNYIRLVNNNSVVDVVINSDKKDLKITKVVFKEQGGAPQAGTSWQADLPLFINYQLVGPDSLKKDGSSDFKLKLSVKLSTTDSKSGQFIISTNHPDKKELTLQGRIDNQ